MIYSIIPSGIDLELRSIIEILAVRNANEKKKQT